MARIRWLGPVSELPDKTASFALRQRLQCDLIWPISLLPGRRAPAIVLGYGATRVRSRSLVNQQLQTALFVGCRSAMPIAEFGRLAWA
jgi:hypothetical protein